MNAHEPDSASDIQTLALKKMAAVLGPERAALLMGRILSERRIELRTPQDLLTFSEALSLQGGFEGAVGAMLGVAAVMRGAGR